MSSHTFKEAVCKLIVTDNLPFTLIESKPFVDLLMLLNPQVEAFLVRADAITDHIMKKYWSEKGKISEMFRSVKSKVSITTDAWSSPNGKDILGVTGHWVDNSGVDLRCS